VPPDLGHALLEVLEPCLEADGIVVRLLGAAEALAEVLVALQDAAGAPGGERRQGLAGGEDGHRHLLNEETRHLPNWRLCRGGA